MNSLFQQALQTYIASFETIWLRSLHLTPIGNSLSPWQRSESKRMVREKGAAWKESQMQIALAPWTFAMRLNTELWRAALAAGARPLSGSGLMALPLHIPQMVGRASQATIGKALDPYWTRTTSNAKRLKQRAIGIKR